MFFFTGCSPGLNARVVSETGKRITQNDLSKIIRKLERAYCPNFLNVCRDNDAGYGALMASAGHTSTHAPQSVHFSASITYIPSPSLIASTGHSDAHAPHEIQSSLIL
jgi:hypothetical protein